MKPIDPLLRQIVEAVSERGIRTHLEQLVEPRDPFEGHASMEAAADTIAETLRGFDLQFVEERFRCEGRWYRNLIALHQGSSRNGQVLIVAHYDTVPNSPGADDNASGVAGLLEVAGTLARHRFTHDLLFIAFPLEEYGNPGSVHYVEQAMASGAPIAGVFDLEMIGYTGPTQAAPPGIQAPTMGDFIGVVGNRRSEGLVALFKEAAVLVAPSLPVQGLVVEGNGEHVPFVRQSDHAPFWDAGYPAVMITDTAFLRNPHYHLPTDTLDTLNLRFLRQVAATTAASAALLADFT
ncbi:MAG: M20/M25/M40 family metallo-hydrolase [Candidatus Methylomirabilis oxygeniifera]|uniref:Peptidase M28 n=1 Tax=Methylomirabilis oxygeniifera TaxID=671143 RepID=D5MFH7_METO1|nr:MAG: M20/M25/M40 family metallo-hydrolase [Candidatus Methylomirabilis oxyfera]CBE68508.1 Peptidase M28 [Candidatus Methylomirabilis oxyfera]